MEITTALLCNWAEVREGLLFVSGGGVTRLWRAGFPAPMGVCVAATVEGTQGEVIGIPHEIQVVVADGDGQTHAEVSGEIRVEGSNAGAGELLQLPVAFNLQMLQVPGPGVYSIRIRLDGGQALGQPERMLTLTAVVTPPA